MILPRAILFDMDGTLTQPMLDFSKIRAEMGIGDRPILEALAELAPDSQAAAKIILERHEDDAAQNSTLNSGCRELLAWIESRGLPTALITRNSERCTNIVLDRHGITLHTKICREHAPFKPNPAGLRLACDRLGIEYADAWMVGDGEYDVAAGIAARMRTVWLSHGREKWFSHQPWQTVADLHQLLELLKGCK